MGSKGKSAVWRVDKARRTANGGHCTVWREGHGKGRVESRVENRVESRREIHVRGFAADTRSQDSDLAQIKDIDELALHREIDLEWV
jgi:hypothetical protein